MLSLEELSLRIRKAIQCLSSLRYYLLDGNQVSIANKVQSLLPEPIKARQSLKVSQSCVPMHQILYQDHIRR